MTTQETVRAQTLRALQRNNSLDDATFLRWINSGVTIEDAVREAAARSSRGAPSMTADIGLTDREARSFSVLRWLRAVTSQRYAEAGFEQEVSNAVAKRLGRQPEIGRLLIPEAALSRGRRDMTAATGSAGGYLVSTTTGGELIEMLRPKSVALQMGARSINGLIGNVAIPKRTASATAQWLTNEATAVTESQQTLGQLTLTPKNVGAYTEISRQLVLQSDPSAEEMVRADLSDTIALAIDTAALNGSGASGQPTGILNTAGIGTFSGTSLGFTGLIEMQTDLAAGNALDPTGAPGFVTTPSVAALLQQRVRFASTASPLWEGGLARGQVLGFPSMSSAQVPSATAIFGDWAQLLIASWGILEVATNPYANFAAGIIGVRCMATVDIGVRQVAAFTAATTIT